jgi:hypothetical protein
MNRRLLEGIAFLGLGMALAAAIPCAKALSCIWDTETRTLSLDSVSLEAGGDAPATEMDKWDAEVKIASDDNGGDSIHLSTADDDRLGSFSP